MAESVFGWELLYSSVESDIKNNHDILLCLTHLVLVSNGFKCIGLGESKVLEGDEKKTERLPKNWNEVYSIRYVYQGKLYILKANNLDDALVLNLIRVDERTPSFLHLNTQNVVDRSGSIDQMIPNYTEIADQIKTQLINKVIISEKSKETAVQTEVRDDRSTLLVDRRGPPRGVDPSSYPIGPDNYGSSDLHPFGIRDPLARIRLPGGGGGMLFQPQGPSFGGGLGGHYPGGTDLPPGAIPPGARFDPYRPPDADGIPFRRQQNRHDNNEFLPPRYDDMFM